MLSAIDTARLRLEPLEPAHAASLFAGLQERGIYRFLHEAPPASLHALERRYQRFAEGVSPDGRERWLNWAVWSHVLAKHIGYVQATVGPDLVAEIGYVLFPEEWGQGHGTEAVGAMLGYLRRGLGVSTVVARVHPHNLRSVALVTRLGFTRVRRDRAGDGNEAVPGDEEYRFG